MNAGGALRDDGFDCSWFWIGGGEGSLRSFIKSFVEHIAGTGLAPSRTCGINGGCGCDASRGGVTGDKRLHVLENGDLAGLLYISCPNQLLRGDITSFSSFSFLKTSPGHLPFTSPSTFLTPSSAPAKARLHTLPTPSSIRSLTSPQSVRCSFLTPPSSSAFHLSFALSQMPARTSRLVGGGNGGRGSTMLVRRRDCWCRRAAWWTRFRVCRLRER